MRLICRKLEYKEKNDSRLRACNVGGGGGGGGGGGEMNTCSFIGD